MKNELREITKSFKAFLESERDYGVTEYFIENENIPLALTLSPMGRGRGEGDKLRQLDALKNTAAGCAECDLCKTRHSVVFGEGNPDADLMFVGEAPGMEEDLQGRPFVGKAGELLNKIIEAMNLKRGDVYIANCLKCRPPQNRAPLPGEILICKHFLESQIKFVNPKVLCGLGRVATISLLNLDKPISVLRGRFHNYNGIKFMPTFHPAYLLRNPADKKLCWQDMKKIMLELNLPDK